MPRPRKWRWINWWPPYWLYVPYGVPIMGLSRIALLMEEVEALRLAHLEGLTQEQAAEKMGISRATFGRILENAHHKISDALISGKAIQIEGGWAMYQGPGGYGRGRGRGAGGGFGPGGGRGRGRMGGGGMGPSGFCVCPNCGHRVPHQPGVPCVTVSCPNCGTKMVRG